MTVCIAATAQYKGTPVIVYASDRQITVGQGMASFEPFQTKTYPLGDGGTNADSPPAVIALIAGDGRSALQLCRATKDRMINQRTSLVADAADIFADEFRAFRRKQSEAAVLGPLNLTLEVLKANGGTEVKTMGDGFMASFGSVTKAVECAIALQRAFADREGEPLSIRVGLNAGEPIEEDGDVFGATVILASRIAAKAAGGEILVADTVRGLCSGKGFLFADRGDFVAKGIEEPVRISKSTGATLLQVSCTCRPRHDRA